MTGKAYSCDSKLENDVLKKFQLTFICSACLLKNTSVCFNFQGINDMKGIIF